MNKLELKRLIKELEPLRARHTELVSIYVPAGFNINIVKNQLSQEYSLSSNIKSKTTRKNVLAAIDKALSELRYYNVTPPNGLVIFSGNVANNPGDMDLRSWSFEPPEPVKVRIYQCEQKFNLEPLREMVEPKRIYGLIVMDDKDMIIGLLKGKKIIVLKEDSSMVPGKTRAGGQSSRRFQRVRQEIIKHWYKIVGDSAVELFSNYDNLAGILVGGAGPAKESFINAGSLGVLNNKVLAVRDTGHSGIVALEELVSKCEDVINNEGLINEKRLVNQFLKHLGKDDGLAVYGLSDVRNALNMGVVELLLISESLNHEVIDELVSLSESNGAKHFFVSTDTREGEQLKQLGGVGAILRYKV